MDTSIGAVVIGWDPNFSYSSLVYASCCLRELPGCLLVSTNNDHADRIGQGALGCERMMPGTGCLVAAVETAADMQAVRLFVWDAFHEMCDERCWGTSIHPESSALCMLTVGYFLAGERWQWWQLPPHTHCLTHRALTRAASACVAAGECGQRR